MPTVGVRLDELARDTAGMSPADLKAVCQEAGLNAMAREAPSVTHEDFTEALERLRSGANRPRQLRLRRPAPLNAHHRERARKLRERRTASFRSSERPPRGACPG
jgi:ATP-dependent Zn protease